jgi:hypothetical protein
MMETLAELPFIGDQVVCLSHEPGRPQRKSSTHAVKEPEPEEEEPEPPPIKRNIRPSLP